MNGLVRHKRIERFTAQLQARTQQIGPRFQGFAQPLDRSFKLAVLYNWRATAENATPAIKTDVVEMLPPTPENSIAAHWRQARKKRKSKLIDADLHEKIRIYNPS